MNTRSDTLYRQLFAHPEIVRDLLAGFLPADWARSLDVSAFERVNASYASDRNKQRHQDMVWRAKVGGEWVYVYILLEFQARSDRWMALRMQVYVGLLLQDLVERRIERRAVGVARRRDASSLTGRQFAPSGILRKDCRCGYCPAQHLDPGAG